MFEDAFEDKIEIASESNEVDDRLEPMLKDAPTSSLTRGYFLFHCLG